MEINGLDILTIAPQTSSAIANCLYEIGKGSKNIYLNATYASPVG
jgi:hypothetical protein